MTARTFSRVEIATPDKASLLNTAFELRLLAADLDHIAGLNHTDDEAVILAQHKIGQTSKKLRNGQ